MKIGVIGAGMVGSASAYAMALMGVGSQLVLVDENRALSRAQADDIAHATPFTSPVVVEAGEIADLENAGIIVIAAGVSQKPGETRLELLDRNAAVFEAIITPVMKVAPNAILLIATNPVDIMTLVATRLSGLPASRVIGSGTILDTARFRSLIGRHLGIASQSVHAYVIGEHGDSEVAVWSSAMAGSVSVSAFARQRGVVLDQATRSDIAVKVRDAAYGIIEGKGATWYGIGAGVARVAGAILDDERVLQSVSIVTTGLEGVPEVPVSLPRIIGAEGVIADLVPDLIVEERAGFVASANVIAEAVSTLKL
ncbi:MAG: L-lactate dehydrogenase [Pseudomonadota bacterium]